MEVLIEVLAEVLVELAADIAGRTELVWTKLMRTEFIQTKLV